MPISTRRRFGHDRWVCQNGKCRHEFTIEDCKRRPRKEPDRTGRTESKLVVFCPVCDQRCVAYFKARKVQVPGWSG